MFRAGKTLVEPLRYSLTQLATLSRAGKALAGPLRPSQSLFRNAHHLFRTGEAPAEPLR